MLAGGTEARRGVGVGGEELGAMSERVDDQALQPVKGERRPEKWELEVAVVFGVVAVARQAVG